jgi:hypothetical protein
MSDYLIVEKIWRVDGFEFATEKQAQDHIMREAVIKKLAALITPALAALDDKDAIEADRHLVRRIDKRNHPMNQMRSLSSADSLPDATLVARAMANRPGPFREALALIKDSWVDLNNIPAELDLEVDA